MRIGFIGVGKIGGPIARQIAAAGHRVRVHDRRLEATRAMGRHGVRSAATLDEAVDDAEAVCTCLPGPAELEALMFNPDGGGLSEMLPSGALYVDMTTSSPDLARRIHAALAARSILAVDSPVSGGVEGAETRDLTALAGGTEAGFERARPILEAAARTVLHVGPAGAGQVCKLVHNAAGFAADMALAECMTLGVKAGVGAPKLFDALRASALGRGLAGNRRLPATWLKGDFEPRFALSTAHKDLSLAMRLGESLGVPMPTVEACRDRMAEAIDRGWAGRDSTIVHTLQEERAGVQVRLD